ncbi:MAG: UDP-glucose/GDP-mannose dehydrogenase family protein [Dysgonamonadaceae bacterium]|jgi:UDPglucose 6-dehydrogenase|nr:UDP-glucose/GDP-mannose dehydrogenase family protein [Dysgonamonadaceae bacterium]MDD3309267.1 UDP-glucose/GDP-mannose dehydrogenase family protein [Dysgonamonadaceae bacterium]MDD3901362.1 UDP-glucose/GDP-mannose dehydrogenase family protein [Dysgonamonadaceae bacterium]MDD4399327.1 UDP-glucose/GDP-mannose dehydrogenase family protein [Dysgonamonadaceae bacterium]MEA5080533.1 UDP-glucose/GDP-mannose dehydrogenase family protein [Dysgonamonadaceae bacterium]
MKIAVVGTGYVGLVSGACFSEMGTDVTCVDIDIDKIEKLKKGIVPIYEPGLKSIVQRNHEADRLHFTTDLASVLNDMNIVFIAVGTPSDEDGNANLSYVKTVAKTIADNLTNPILVVTKSTVPVGTSYMIKDLIRKRLDERGLTDLQFDVASNPEFLKEGAAVEDFMSPDRVVVGVESEQAEELMTRLYRPFLLNNFRVIFMDILSSEMTKYASNAMLATRISFMNDIANLCELLGADVNMVRRGMGTDSRIGKNFLYPGCGYGGSCFPKDIRAIIKMGEDVGYEMNVLKSVENVNNKQKTILFYKFNKYFDGDIKGKTVAVWGLSFKPETDDMRDAPSLTLISSLQEAGVNVRAYDPAAMKEAKEKYLGDSIYYATDIYDAANNADAIIVPTEWKEFRMPNWDVLHKIMNNFLIVDGRNIYNSEEVNSNGFDYRGVGK